MRESRTACKPHRAGGWTTAGGYNNMQMESPEPGMVPAPVGTQATQELVITIGIKELLEAGVHFGHQTRRWNPRMKKYIFDARNGIHIIDLSKTLTQLESACHFLEQTVGKGGKVLFVGTKKQAQQAVREAAETCGQPFVVERWLGGTLTNLKTIKRSLGRLKHIEQLEADGSISGYVKQEQSSLRREAARLNKNLGGIRTLDNHPDAVFIVDIKREHNAVAEARRMTEIVALLKTHWPDRQMDPPSGMTAYDIAVESEAFPHGVRQLLAAFGSGGG